MSRAGNAPDANVIAEATINILHQMTAQLVPVIGAGGFDVLFNRQDTAGNEYRRNSFLVFV